MFVSGSRQTAQCWRLRPGAVSSWQQEGMQQSVLASHTHTLTHAHVFLIVNTCNLSRSLPLSLSLSLALQVSHCLLWIVQMSSTPTRVDFAVAQLTALTVSWLTLWLPLIAVTVRLSLAFPPPPSSFLQPLITRYPFPFNFCFLHCVALRFVWFRCAFIIIAGIIIGFIASFIVVVVMCFVCTDDVRCLLCLPALSAIFHPRAWLESPLVIIIIVVATVACALCVHCAVVAATVCCTPCKWLFNVCRICLAAL